MKNGESNIFLFKKKIVVKIFYFQHLKKLPIHQFALCNLIEFLFFILKQIRAKSILSGTVWEGRFSTIIDFNKCSGKVWWGSDISFSANIVIEKIAQFGWVLLSYLPYWLDLAPSDYHLFRSGLKHTKFENEEELSSGIIRFSESEELLIYLDVGQKS